MEAERKLLGAASIETLIPEDSEMPLADLLHDESSFAETAMGILQVKRRNLLFVDERIRSLAVLQIPKCEEQLLQGVLARTEIRLEVWAFDKSHDDEQPNAPMEPVKDLIYSAIVPQIEDPIVLAQQVRDETLHGALLTLVWEVELVLHRPRVRMSDPSIYVHSILLVSPSAIESSFEVNVLEPFRPMEANVLEPLNHLSNDAIQSPYLAVSRLQKVIPAIPRPNKDFRIEHMSPKYVIAPATIARMRFINQASSAIPSATIASLDLEMIPFVEVNASIEKVDMSIASGKIENLMPNFLPMDCRSRDLVTFLFRLHPAAIPGAAVTPSTPTLLANIDVLSISIRIRLTTLAGCHSTIFMDWTTNVDFFRALNPSFGTPSQPLQPTNQPQTLSLSSGIMNGSQTISTSLQPTMALAASEHLSISFAAGVEAVKVGQPFTWSVLVVNKTSQAAKITIVPLPRIPKAAAPVSHFQKRHAPKSSTASFHPAERRHVQDPETDVEFAQAIMGENVLYAMQHANLVPPETDLMSLTAELRIGPLDPGQCHEGLIELVAFKTGVLRVDAMRVIDNIKEMEKGVSAAGVVTDIRDLPDVLVKAAEEMDLA